MTDEIRNIMQDDTDTNNKPEEETTSEEWKTPDEGEGMPEEEKSDDMNG